LHAVFEGELPLVEGRGVPATGTLYEAPQQEMEEEIRAQYKEIRARKRSSVDASGIEWHARPPHYLPRFQRDLMAEAYRATGVKFGCPFAVKVEDGIVSVKLEDNFNPKRVIKKLSLDEIAKLMEERDANVDKLMAMNNRMTASASDIRAMADLYIRFTLFMECRVSFVFGPKGIYQRSSPGFPVKFVRKY